MAHRYLTPLVLGILFLPIFIGCTNDPVAPEKPFVVTGENLPMLVGEAYYELWFSYPKAGADRKGPRVDHEDANYFSTGKFIVDAAGNLMTTTGTPARFAIPEGFNAQLIADAIVTVERPGSTDHGPGRRILSGLFTGTERHASATLDPLDGEALGGKLFSDSAGFFSLSAPTSDSPADSVSGIWFTRFLFDLSGNPIDTVEGLKLAPQPLNPDNPGWTYQAWLVRNGESAQPEYVKLGAFNFSNRADSTGAGPGAGAFPARFYGHPGEDFVAGTRRLLNDGTYSVLVSVDPTGFGLSRPVVRVLESGTIAAGTPSRTALPMFRPNKLPTLQIELDR